MNAPVNNPLKINRRSSSWVLRVAASLISTALALFNSPILAADSGSPSVRSSTNSVTDLSLEDLVNIKVTSVSKKEENLNDAAAAIYVITQEDIRRSGLTTIPELLRMVPGLDVARIDAHQWAVSSRGFNDQFSNKLLVMVDGRSVYQATFSGVYWDTMDMVLEDLDRIEVIRGPGAALWGANAVDGVINIITKSARETQGTLISTSVGTEDLPSTSIRYGGQAASNLFYRVYVKGFHRDGLVDSAGRDAPDDWSVVHGGFRMDWEPSTENTFVLQSDYFGSQAGLSESAPIFTAPFSTNFNIVRDDNGGNALGRWTHSFSKTSQLSLQASYAYSDYVQTLNKIEDHTADFDLQDRFSLGTRNDIIWGLGYRYYADHKPPSAVLVWTPENRTARLYTAFLQDEITLVPDRLRLILGSKLEHNSFTGFEVEPSSRLLWTPTDHQTIWAAVSRAVRTPDIFDLDAHFGVAAFQAPGDPNPTVIELVGNPHAKSEHLLAYELGYRFEPIKQMSFDIASFYNVYDHLLGNVTGAPFLEANPPPPHEVVPQIFANNESGYTYGAELAAQWRPVDCWRLVLGYTWLHMHLQPDPSPEGDSPQQQAQLRSYLTLPHDLELNAAAFYVDRLPNQHAPAYLRLDLGLVWHPTTSLEIGIWGQNLLDNQHPEFTSQTTALQTEVPRSVVGKITWRF